MPRILLVSYHYRPMGVVASERAHAWAENLARLGWQVDVLTHDWVPNGPHWQISEELVVREKVSEKLTIHRVGLSAEQKLRMQRSEAPSRLRVLKQWLAGWFDPNAEMRLSHEALFDYASALLQTETFDVIFTLFSPYAHVRLAYKLHQTSGVPYHVDFRDLDDNMLARPGYRPKGTLWLRHQLVKHFWKRWLRNALSTSGATESVKRHLAEVYKVNCITLHTGFELNRLQESREPSETFRLVYTGSLYTHQHYRACVEGIRRFLAEQQTDDIEVIFQGVEREVTRERPGSYSSTAVQLIREQLKDPRVKIGPRIGVEEVRKLQRNSSVLLMPTHANVPGIVSGKLFEYMGSQTRILAIPTDQWAIADILNESDAGRCVDTPEEYAVVLAQWYQEWKQQNPLPPLAPLDHRLSFSQKERAGELSAFLKEGLRG